jgi:hypothetical protein
MAKRRVPGTRPCAYRRINRAKSAFLNCDSPGEMPGNPPGLSKIVVFRGFLAHFGDGAVTLHQEMNGITRWPAAEMRFKNPRKPPVR